MGEKIFSECYSLDEETAQRLIYKKRFLGSPIKLIFELVLVACAAVYFAVSFLIYKDTLSLLLMIFCIFLFASAFISPYLSSKAQARIFESGVSFTLSLFENGALIERGENKTELEFKKIKEVILSQDCLYIESEKRYFPIPIKSFSEQNLKALKEIFEDNLTEKFKNRQKKI